MPRRTPGFRSGPAGAMGPAPRPRHAAPTRRARPVQPEDRAMPTRHEADGTQRDIVSLASVAPGADVIVELIGPTARGRAATVALHEGQVVECRARGSSGVVL